MKKIIVFMLLMLAVNVHAASKTTATLPPSSPPQLNVGRYQLMQARYYDTNALADVTRVPVEELFMLDTVTGTLYVCNRDNEYTQTAMGVRKITLSKSCKLFDEQVTFTMDELENARKILHGK